MSTNRAIFFISDGTGITAETLGNSLLTQFDKVDFQRFTIPFVNNETAAKEAVMTINLKAQQNGTRPIVIGTVVDPKLRALLMKSEALYLDIFEKFIPPLEEELHAASNAAVGILHGIRDTESYDDRIDAVNFALTFDDGSMLRGYENADVIIVGVSRSGKTPTCLYLALMFGIRAANYPLTDEDFKLHELPASLRAYQKKIVGLTISPERLMEIRQSRRANSDYASLEKCEQEIKWAENLFKKDGIPYLNSTSRSIEEISSQVMQLTGIARHLS